MKTRSLLLIAAFTTAFLSAQPAGAVDIAPGATYSQNFDDIGNSKTATLPSGWKVAASSSIRAVSSTEYSAAGTQTAQAGTGSVSTGGIYNFWDAADSSDHGVGFLATKSATKTGNLYLSLTATGDIPSFTISYDVKLYRNNATQFQFQLYYSTDDGTTWTSAGSSFLRKPSTGDSGGSNPAGTTPVSATKLNVALASGETIILCWSYSVPSGSTTSNAQGLGIDNVVIAASYPNRAPVASQASESVAATAGVAASLDLSDYFSDADGDALTYAVASGVGTVSGSTWTYTPAAAGSYSAVVSATDSYGASATMSIAVTAEEPQLPILDTPTGLVDSNVSFTSFGLSWNAVSGADGYVVTLSPADGSVVVSGTSATASGLSEGTTYTVNVVATGTGAIDSSAASLEVQTLVHVQLAAPAGLAASSVTDSGFTLSWSAVANAANYSVSVLDGNDAATGTVSVSGTTATVTGLSADTAYTAKVQALKPSGDTPYLDSEWSDTVSVTTELADGLKRAILFNETFDKVAGAGWQYSGNIQNTDETGWSFGTDTVRGPKGIRLGTSNNPSSATTREIAVSNALDSTEVVISFLAAAYSGKTSAGTLTLIDAATDGETVLTNLTPAAMSNGTGDPLAGGTSYEVAASVPSRFKLRFESLSTASDKRLLLDSIKVTQVYDPNIQTVGAPTVSVSGETTSGFTVSWTDADENAESYDLMVTSAGGSTTNLSVSGVMSPYAVSGLAAGTVYTAFVRAVGDNLHFAPSAWASASAETEALSYDVEFSVDGSAEGPFSRTVRAGNAVSFTVAAALVSNGGTSEDVTGSISTDFPSGSFNPATGAFSWTPSEANVGTTDIGFSVTANGVTFTETVAVTVLSNYRDETLFRETFVNIGNHSWSSTTTTPVTFPTRTTATDNDLWSGTNCIVANYAIRLGKASVFGHATTPVIETKGSGPAELTLAFRCARTSGSGRVAVTVADLSGQTIYAITNTPISETVSGYNAIGDEHGMTNTFAFAAGGAFTVTFAPLDDGRVGIDEIEVFQTVPAASAPVTLETVHSSATSDAKVNGFTATWGAVANAEGYSVMVFDRNGAYVPGATASVDSANCRAVITGLSPASRYYVKVKALGDGSATWDSAWSAASLADTTNPPTVISVW